MAVSVQFGAMKGNKKMWAMWSMWALFAPAWTVMIIHRTI